MNNYELKTWSCNALRYNDIIVGNVRSLCIWATIIKVLWYMSVYVVASKPLELLHMGPTT